MAKRATRSQVIGTLIFDAVLQARLKWNEYAGTVVQHYHDLTAVEDRIVDFHVASTAENFDNCARLNTQTVKRILSGEIRMCVDIEESLIAALPDAHRDHLLSVLLARDGLLLARRPVTDTQGAQVGSVCDLMRLTANAVDRILPLLADDNRIGPEDAAHLAQASQGINLVMGACITLNAQIAVAAGAVPSPATRPSLKAVH